MIHGTGFIQLFPFLLYMACVFMFMVSSIQFYHMSKPLQKSPLVKYSAITKISPQTSFSPSHIFHNI